MARNRGLMAYFGITHGVPLWALWAWKRVNCVRNIHAFDEVAATPDNNYLVCDACGLTVYIDRIETKWVDGRRLAAMRKAGK